jgi:hypothetical protein
MKSNRRSKFQRTLWRPAKRESTNIGAKVRIRENVLLAIGADRASVFDAFAAAGKLHKAVWHRAHSYVGCDLQFFRDDRLAFVADNRRVLRCLDLAQFNLFDLDAFGSPWEQAYIIAKRRPMAAGERLGLVLTEGSALKLKFGSTPQTLAYIVDVDFRHMAGMGMARGQDWLVNRAIDRIAMMMNAAIVHRWQAIGKMGSRMYYLGLVLEGMAPG